MSQPPDRVDFGSISERRKLALAAFDLCAVCGHPFHDELRWQVAFEEQVLDMDPALHGEAPVHEVCGLYAAQICPFVSSPHARLGDQWRKGSRRPEKVLLAGYRRTGEVLGRASGLQTGHAVLHFDMGGLDRVHVLRNAEEARAAYERALTEEAPVVLDAQERRLVDLLVNLTRQEPAGEDSGGVMAGAAWMVGGAFCPGVRDVMTMQHYVDGPAYDTIAATVVAKPRMAARLAVESTDEATATAMDWLATRRSLPPVLQRWHAEGRRRVRTDRRSSRPSDTAVDIRKARRKSQAAARKKNRR
ncbi:hypothetical protein [Saccharothrix obliqua]|uniref:hypothetical protein n=1 Tax=Saccharothrix obliqua TaxID=2861747 RepID=UPI001C5D52EF|nr:hypothetical protein [Saccharothrix obliqua]MBW4722144.1 hypothetical protein [Saccharothrix obliqua]